MVLAARDQGPNLERFSAGRDRVTPRLTVVLHAGCLLPTRGCNRSGNR